MMRADLAMIVNVLAIGGISAYQGDQPNAGA
jgi:hypothetical protein